ncbi:MAG: universal stress protein [Gemmatimonadales bacterium]
MYQTILVPWDGSALSETAFTMAVPIARRHKARVQIVHVRQPPPLVGLAPMYDTRLDGEQGDRVRTEEQALAERLSKDSGVVVDAEFLEGDILPTLVAYAERTGPDLVVMTTHGRGGLSRLWLGSITDAIVRALHIPILVTRGSTRDTTADGPVFPRVLVPLDGSVEAEAVFPAISALVTPDEATLALLRVVIPLSPSNAQLQIDPFTGPPNTFSIETDTAEASAYLANVAKSLGANGIRATTHVGTSQSVASAILNFASESPNASGNAFDLIVLTPHERPPINRLLLGSVTDKVLRGAEIPVLLLHRPPGAMRESDDG